MPVLPEHLVVALGGKGKLRVAVPAKEPVLVPPLVTVVENLALTKTTLDPNRPSATYSLPLHDVVMAGKASVVPIVTQLSGEVGNEPKTLPLVMAMEFGCAIPTLGVHAFSLALIREGLVPPPFVVSGGENKTVAFTAQTTVPGALPYITARPVLAST